MRLLLPPLTFYPLSENIAAKTTLNLHEHSGSCTPSKASFLRLFPLRRFRCRESTLITRACLTLYVPLSGFDHPLNGLLLPVLRAIFQAPASLGFPPSEFYPLQGSRSSFEAHGALLPLKPPESAVSSESPGLQSFTPLAEPVSWAAVTQTQGPFLSWGSTSEAFLPCNRCPPFEVSSSYALYTQNSRSRFPCLAPWSLGCHRIDESPFGIHQPL